jgi:hypothetical protein
MIAALISQVKGLAVFDTDDCLCFVSASQLGEILYDEQGFYEREVAEAPDLEAIEVEDLDSLRKHLAMRRSREELLHATLILLDTAWSRELRETAARTITQELSSEDFAWVQGVLSSVPLPESANPQEASLLCPEIGDFLVQLAELQCELKLLRTAWHALPDGMFQNESRDQVRAKVVRCGGFRNLLFGGVHLRKNPFVYSLARYKNYLRTECSNSQNLRSESHGQLLLNATRSQVWDVAPWRSACLASEWPRIESRLSCERASMWLSEFDLRQTLLRSSDEPDFVDIYSAWNSLRYHSPISKAVDLVHALANQNQDSRATTWVVVEPKRWAAERASHHYLGSGYLHKESSSGREAETLERVILAFFCSDNVSSSGQRTGKVWALGSRQPEISPPGTTDREVLTQQVHAAIDSLESFDHKALVYRPEHETLSAISAGGTLATWVDRVIDVISVYALDRIFSQDGCVVWAPNDTGGVMQKTTPYAALMNPRMRRSRVFDGYIALVLRVLQHRLVADLRSGLPRSRCGWVGIEQLAKDVARNGRSLEGDIDALRSDVSEAGFPSETLQQRSDGVRLNPEFAVSARGNLQSAIFA